MFCLKKWTCKIFFILEQFCQLQFVFNYKDIEIDFKLSFLGWYCKSITEFDFSSEVNFMKFMLHFSLSL